MKTTLDSLTRKLYEDGIVKAQKDADDIIEQAKLKAARIVEEAENKRKSMIAETNDECENLRKKADSEMTLASRQALSKVKQEINAIVSSGIARNLAENIMSDRELLHSLIADIVRKWSVNDSDINLEVILSEKNKAAFDAYLISKCKDLLDSGLSLKVADVDESFVVSSKDGSYQVSFSDELFEAFFAKYIKGFTKSILFNK